MAWFEKICILTGVYITHIDMGKGRTLNHMPPPQHSSWGVYSPPIFGKGRLFPHMIPNNTLQCLHRGSYLRGTPQGCNVIYLYGFIYNTQYGMTLYDVHLSKVVHCSIFPTGEYVLRGTPLGCTVIQLLCLIYMTEHGLPHRGIQWFISTVLDTNMVYPTGVYIVVKWLSSDTFSTTHGFTPL